MEMLIQNLRYAVRMMVKTPGVTAVALASLALGIGANTTIFTLVNAVFLRGLPVEDPSSLVAVYTTDSTQAAGGPGNLLPVSRPNFEDLRDRNQAFSGVADILFAGASLTGPDGEPEPVAGQLVSGNYFDLLGVEPAAGRFFTPQEDAVPDRDPVVVLDHDFWQERFGGDPGIVGQDITLNGRAFTVVGVAPAGFHGTFLLAGPAFWVPAAMHDAFLTGTLRGWYQERRALITLVFARLRPGVAPREAKAGLAVLGQALESQFPVANKGRSFTLLPLNQALLPPAVRGVFAQAGGLLMAIVGLVLLIACANVANLLLGRALARRQEIAVRLSLGASRGRLVLQLLTESVFLALVAAALGLTLAYWGRNLLWSFRPPFLQQSALDLTLDPTVLGFTFVVAVATGLVFGLAPALQATRPDVVADLKASAGGEGRSHRWWSARNVLVVGQVALSFVALIGSGLFLRSLGRATDIDPGFQVDRLAMLGVNAAAAGYDEARGRQLYERLLERVASVPGVEAAALAADVPLGGGGLGRTVIVEGRDPDAEGNSILTTVDPVSEGYFRTMGIPIQRGRGFTAADRQDAPFVAIVNETAARRFWPDGDALGGRFRFFGEDWVLEVVGIAADSKYGTLGEDPTPYIYLPLRQHYIPAANLFVRTGGNPALLIATVRNEVRLLDRALPIANVQTMEDVLSQSLWGARMGAGLLGALGALALLLALGGIYGVMAYSVHQRSREIGIRMALGAARADVVRLFLARGMGVVATGLGAGLLLAFLGSRAIATLLYGMSATDPTTFTTTALALVAVAFFANLVPARKATVIDPVVVLKTER